MALLRQADSLKGSPTSIVPIKPEGSRPPIFAVSGHGGDVFRLLPLARHLHPDQPMIGIQPPGLDGSEPLQTLEELARYEITQIRHYRRDGPFLIAGHCAGGTLAFEVAQQLTAAGQQVAFLALIGSPFPAMFSPASLLWLRLSGYGKAINPTEFKRKLRSRRERQQAEQIVDRSELSARLRVENATVAAVHNYQPKLYPGRVDIFVTKDAWHRAHLWSPFAKTLCEHRLEDYEVNDLLSDAHVSALAATFQNTLDGLSHAGSNAHA
jgi:thioesterase domain-containing protein